MSVATRFLALYPGNSLKGDISVTTSMTTGLSVRALLDMDIDVTTSITPSLIVYKPVQTAYIICS